MVTKRLSDTAERAARTTTKAATDLAPADVLADSVRALTKTVTTRAVSSLTDRLGTATERLTDYSAGNGTSLLTAVTGLEKGAVGKLAAGTVKAGLSGAGHGIAGGAKNAVQGLADGVKKALGGGKGDKIKVTNIVEQLDVGLDLEPTYDLFTRFTDFPKFMKKVENVEQVSDEKLEWQAQIFWSHRTWEASILEQVPYERIVWRAKGAKGFTDGAVTFHELAPNLTRIMLVLEYHPKGLFEHTANLWRAQGRRARLELKHFGRHAMAHAALHPDDISGWPGEIHDGTVVEPDEGEPDEDDNGSENP